MAVLKYKSSDGTWKAIATSGGGSSSGSGAYSEVDHGTSDTTFALTPNTFHVWEEVSALTLTLGSETAGVANEYLFQFTSGATATSLTLPDDIKWANDSAPTIAENKIYQVSILKGLASVLSWEGEVASVPIVFYIDYIKRDAMSNMTWEQFVNSGYNADGAFNIYNDYVYLGNSLVHYSSTPINIADVIIENGSYTTQIGGGGSGS